MRRQNKAAQAGASAFPSPDFTAINTAVEKHLDSGLSEATWKKLRRSLGDREFETIKQIIAFASNQDAWVQASNLSAAADAVSGRLSQTYPLLSETAVFRIVSQATYGWR